LTVGDSSTNYQKDRRPAAEIGKKKNFANSRGRSTVTETFNKLQSNAIGDEYQDAGQYFLRTDNKKKNKGVFKRGYNGSLTRHSEFSHQKEYVYHNPGPMNTKTNFMARSTTEAFQ